MTIKRPLPRISSVISRWARAPAGLAAILALGVVAWQLFLFADVLAQGEVKPLTWALHLVTDAYLLFGLAWIALRGGLLVARKLRMDAGSWAAHLTAAALTSLLLIAMAIPTLALRDLLQQRVETGSWLSSDGIALASQAGGDPFMCSLLNVGLRAAGARPSVGASLQMLLVHGLRNVAVLQLCLLPLTVLTLYWRSRPERRAGRRVTPSLRGLRPLLFTGLIVLISCAGPTDSSEPEDTDPVESSLVNACTTGGPLKTFNVSAISIDMPLNRFGDHDPGAFMYVLNSKIAAVQAQAAIPPTNPNKVSTGLRKDPIQPLVIRANLGDCVKINFTNKLTSKASMHIHGLRHSASDAGSATGANADTFAAPNQTITYTLATPTDPAAEGAYYIHDHGSSRQRVAHGLFAALVLEPQGSTFLDPQTGANLNGDNNWEALISVPAPGVSFREDVIVYHEIGDESFTGVLDKNGAALPQVDSIAGIYRPAGRALNYRSEPFRNRLSLHKDESQSYGSYMFGDPATPTPFSYLGDPTKTRLMHGGSELFHVHHLHGGGDRWRRNPKTEPSDFAAGLQKVPLQNVLSTRLDSQALGPGTAFNVESECGAGGCQQAAGDFLFHCHIQNHYLAGMWAFWRVYDTLQPNLAPVPGRTPPSAVDSNGLIGKVIEGKTVVLAKNLVDPSTQRSLESWVEGQLPPKGQRFGIEDATVWDWDTDPSNPSLYRREPDDTNVWADYASPTPGQRSPILFNPRNGRYAWPLMRPHLGMRPPFAPQAHGGAPWLGADGTSTRPDGLCPSTSVVPGRNIRQYPVSFIQTPIQMTPKATDPNGMIFVLSEDKAAVLGGTKPKQPLVIRSNVGDCVNLLLTNDVPDNAGIVGPHSKVNMHTHFVQFDPQASDGVIAGMSYEQSVRPFLTENRSLTTSAGGGATTIAVSNLTNLRVGIAIGVGLGQGMCTPPGGGSVPCTEIRNITAINTGANTLTLDSPLVLSHNQGESVGVEFVQYKWYSDVDFGTVFWHDHITVGGWSHGTFGSHIVEPKGSTYNDPVTGAQVRSGTLVDIRTPSSATVGTGQSGSFRELYVGLSDAVSLSGGGGTINGTINLRADPLTDRRVSGSSNLEFSSVRFGDPVTPLAHAYLGDPFVIRGLGAVEFVGSLRVTGHRFRLERFATNGALSDTAPIGISERFDLVLDGGAGGTSGKPGDYLYYSSLGRMFTSGAWGILRVHDKSQSNLQPLPGHTPPSGGGGFPTQTFTGGSPAVGTAPGNPCPASAPSCCQSPKHFDVTISHPGVKYNASLTDSNGVAYSMTGQGGGAATTPLVLRVNNGDCLEIKLTNNVSIPASLSLGQLPFDPQGSYGAAIGYNLDTTTPPGGSKVYRYFADKELGISVMLDLADPTSIPRGAYGAVVVEPTGSVYKDSITGALLTSGVQASVIAPSTRFRELVTLFADEDAIIGHNTMPYPTAVGGFAGIDYSAESFSTRLAGNPDPSLVFNSAAHGDPRLVARAHTGDAFIFRVAQAWGDQGHVFAIEGHQFPMEPNMPGSEQKYSMSLFPGYSFNPPLSEGAGGGIGATGDYLFLDHRQPFMEAGLWGLLRVLPAGNTAIKPLAAL